MKITYESGEMLHRGIVHFLYGLREVVLQPLRHDLVLDDLTEGYCNNHIHLSQHHIHLVNTIFI